MNGISIMADRRIPDDELGLEVLFSFDWKRDGVINKVWDVARAMIEETLEKAQEFAQQNVEKRTGPSKHDGKGTDGHHTELHGFDWKDTGDLKSAIKLRYNFAEVKPGAKKAGMPRGQLYVEPIEVENYYTPAKRKINYGAYLEFGFNPIITRKMGGQSVKVRGHLTRYPFLSPALYAACHDFVDKTAVEMRKQIRDLAANTPGKRKRKRILVDEPITMDGMLRRHQRVIEEAVQFVDMSHEKALSSVQSARDTLEDLKRREAARAERKKKAT